MVIEKIIKNIQYPVVLSLGKENELVENLDIDKQVEALIEKIELIIEEDLNVLNIKARLEKKEVAYIQLLNAGFYMYLQTFYNCNAKGKIDKDDLYKFAIEKLADKKIPLLGLALIIKIIPLIKEKFINKLVLVESSYAEERGFYKKAFDCMKQKGYIKDYKKKGRDYFITLY